MSNRRVFPKGLFRFGVVALARIFQISSYNVFQYVIELIKPKLHLAKLSIQTIFFGWVSKNK